jgi:hypothetical protein
LRLSCFERDAKVIPKLEKSGIAQPSTPSIYADCSYPNIKPSLLYYSALSTIAFAFQNLSATNVSKKSQIPRMQTELATQLFPVSFLLSAVNTWFPPPSKTFGSKTKSRIKNT